jgi:hypothetical protein
LGPYRLKGWGGSDRVNALQIGGEELAGPSMTTIAVHWTRCFVWTIIDLAEKLEAPIHAALITARARLRSLYNRRGAGQLAKSTSGQL